jgi:hypothetical protein
MAIAETPRGAIIKASICLKPSFPCGFDVLVVTAAGKRASHSSAAKKGKPSLWSGERSRLNGWNREFDLTGLLWMTFQPVEAIRAQQDEMNQKCENHEEGEQSHQSSARIE